MINKFDEAIEVLAGGKADSISESSTATDTEVLVHSVNKQVVLPERISVGTVTRMNKAAVKLCAGDFIGAKEALDELLESDQLRLTSTDSSAESLLPGHLLNILVYFFLRTKNFKMARHLAKNRRFLIDSNYVEPPPS